MLIRSRAQACLHELTNWTDPPGLTADDQSRSYSGASGDERRHFQTPTFSFILSLFFTFYSEVSFYLLRSNFK